jgi:hypothetical protein
MKKRREEKERSRREREGGRETIQNTNAINHDKNTKKLMGQKCITCQ